MENVVSHVSSLHFLFGLTGWLVNAVTLPQIQKQTSLDLLHRQCGWLQDGRMLIPAIILVTGIELGFFMTPFRPLATNDFLSILLPRFLDELFREVFSYLSVGWLTFTFLVVP